MENIYNLSAKVIGFYDSPIWRTNEAAPKYFKLFSWTEFGCSEEIPNFIGTLKEELFDTQDKKIAYLQGIFEAHGMSNMLHFANSSLTVERCKKWINEIAWDRKLISTFIGQGILSHSITYTCPMFNMLEVNSLIVDFIKQYQLKNI